MKLASASATFTIALSLTVQSVAVPTKANASEANTDAILAAFELCREGPTDLTAAKNTLAGVGWVEAEPGAVVITLGNALLARSFDATRWEASFRDSFFIAASTLGNSSLGPNQAGFVFEDYELALIGVEEKMPYCSLVGPEHLHETATRNSWHSNVGARTEYLTIQLGMKEGAFFALGLLNKENIIKLVEQTSDGEFPDKSEMVSEIRDEIKPAAISIHPAVTVRQWSAEK